MSDSQLNKNLQALPELVYIDNSDARVPVKATILGIKRGESGFYPIVTKLTADELNAPLNVTAAQIEAMFVGSMFGWDVPSAHPDAYPELSTENVDKPVDKD
jgi:hypothetical protein